MRRTPGRLGIGFILLLVVITASGCRTLSYYAQAAKGQATILARQRPITRILADTKASPKLRQRLELVLRLRDFAEKELRLPVKRHYSRYADLGRPFVVWNVEAAPRFSMEPKSWWYPVVGRLEYRGYFAEASARRFGDYLADNGYDVQVGGVTAYSTLGWFSDPVLNTFVWDEDTQLAETLFHELAHQRVFARGDKDFNEAFATLVGREGVRRWLAATHGGAEYGVYEAGTAREDEFAALVIRTRRKLEKLYGDEIDEDGKTRATKAQAAVPRELLSREKERVFSEMRREYEEMRIRWDGRKDYDNWFSRPPNNARLNSVAAYHELVPGFRRLLDLNKGELAAFYDAADRLAKMKREPRRQWLAVIASGLENPTNNLHQVESGIGTR